ncbi:hypothetical protein [Chryseobacterium herbae]|uniref:Uncharacterized protein n=1 Tax=Chryseobacterium herbae TaxID=2976476 RepID=A0ABT2IYP7_9FLAO|nr:hypothetical protein [Chryseobacterium sp. pc1-10]MCT2563971.1 hypothetical protein [Chryseobacterium sp. pc1-10]
MNPKEELKVLFAHRPNLEVAMEVFGFSGRRTTIIDDLTEEEASMLLSIHTPNEENLEEEYNALKEELFKKGWKGKILKLAESTGIKDKGDFNRFNNWMLTKSVFKKHLNAHSIEELKYVHKQLQGVKYNNAQSAKKPMNKAWWKKGDELVNLN